MLSPCARPLCPRQRIGHRMLSSLYRLSSEKCTTTGPASTTLYGKERWRRCFAPRLKKTIRHCTLCAKREFCGQKREQPRRCKETPESTAAGRKPPAGATVWATENPVWATENPVTLTVMPQSLCLRPVGEGRFRGFGGEFSEVLTNTPSSSAACAINCQNLTRHTCVICGRGGAWWISRPLSALTCVNCAIAHSASPTAGHGCFGRLHTHI